MAQVAPIPMEKPSSADIPIYVMIIASVVSVVQMLINAYAFGLYQSLGIFPRALVAVEVTASRGHIPSSWTSAELFFHNPWTMTSFTSLMALQPAPLDAGGDPYSDLRDDYRLGSQRGTNAYQRPRPRALVAVEVTASRGHIPSSWTSAELFFHNPWT
jgi:hypothetical protein